MHKLRSGSCKAPPKKSGATGIGMPQPPDVIATKATNSLMPAARTPRAAQYVRMSTDHQSYSPANQADANGSYAKARGIEIVVTYYDPGISQSNTIGRVALVKVDHSFFISSRTACSLFTHSSKLVCRRPPSKSD